MKDWIFFVTDAPNNSVNTHYHHVADHMTSLNFLSPFFCFSPNPKASTVQHTSVTARDPNGIKSQISDFYHFIFNLYQKEVHEHWLTRTPLICRLSFPARNLNYDEGLVLGTGNSCFRTVAAVIIIRGQSWGYLFATQSEVTVSSFSGSEKRSFKAGEIMLPSNSPK